MERIKFVKIVDNKGVSDIEALIQNNEKKTHLFEAPFCKLQKGGYIILDFGKELCGRLHVSYSWNANGKIRVRTGESVAEVCAEIGEHNATNDHAIHDAVLPFTQLSDLSTTETGFRFARVDLVEPEEAKIVSIYAEATPNGLTRAGEFHCDDPRVNEIYETAARTISLCVRSDEIWDGVKRDRAVWIGDLYPELVGAFTLYGDAPQFKKVLDMIEDFETCWVNHIPSYSAWWLLCLCRYCELTGDKGYFSAKLPYVKKIINAFDEIVKEDGNLVFTDSSLSYFPNNEFFIDWPTHETSDSEEGWRYLVTYAMGKVGDALNGVGESNEKTKSIIARLDMHLYVSSEFKQVNALGILANRIDSEAALKNIKEGGAKGMTTFMSFVIIEALEKLGQGELALSIIKEYYGAMLDMGATTFWEDFDMEWLKDNPLPITALPDQNRKNIHADYGKYCYKGLRHSLCHGWSSGFLPFFYDYILGIKMVEPGYKAIRVEPRLCGLKEASGTLPTIYGPIKVSHKLVDGKIVSDVSVPDGITLSM